MTAKHVLIIDDEPDICELIEITLARMGLNSRSAMNVADALNLIEAEHFDLCLTDMRLPDGDGIEMVKYVQKNHPNIPIAVITAHGNVETAVQALKLGAFDFISKPLDLGNLRNIVESALRVGASHDQKAKLLGESASMHKLREMIDRVANSQAPVHISGESGTGKELVARALHEHSPRVDAPFIALNTTAIASELLESELFGHERGAFTGADRLRIGRFEQADGGTLFLDEIGDMSVDLQTRLLRVLAEGEFFRVGGQKAIHVDVRIIAATNQKYSKRLENNASYKRLPLNPEPFRPCPHPLPCFRPSC